MRRLLLCTDLDRTLLPNGALPESPAAKSLFERMVSRPEITLAYVTGRHRALIEQAIAEYDLPQPTFAIADVGSTIYRIDSGRWQLCRDWGSCLADDWRGHSSGELLACLRDIDNLNPQEPAKQNHYKISFYVPLTAAVPPLVRKVAARLEPLGVRANLIWSIDEQESVRLLDILPAGANKLLAIRYVLQRESFSLDGTLFAGDSGNDLDVLTSEIPSVLVANAADEVKEAAAKQSSSAFYMARGGCLGMNGNYRAGILEGITHFWPEAKGWLEEIACYKAD